MQHQTWQEALETLKVGNQRFLDNKMHKVLKQDWESLSKEQNPFAAVLCCSDSRVSPDLMFDCDLGDLFVIQNAGNVTDVSVKGSFQYAIQVLKIPLIIVLGHTGCGAVTAAHKHKEMKGPLQSIVSLIDGNVVEGEVVDSIRNHAVNTAKKLRMALDFYRDLIGQEVRVVPALYDISNGKISWLDLKDFT